MQNGGSGLCNFPAVTVNETVQESTPMSVSYIPASFPGLNSALGSIRLSYSWEFHTQELEYCLGIPSSEQDGTVVWRDWPK